MAIYETLADFSKREKLIGWVQSNENIDSSKITSELIRLNEKNRKLINEIDELKGMYKEIKTKKLLNRRLGYSINATIDGEEISVTSNEFEDGTIGEIFINMSKIGTSLGQILACFATAVSIGLQYGIPLEEFYEEFSFIRFEPSGMVENHPKIKSATSVLDFTFRALGLEYLDKRIDT